MNPIYKFELSTKYNGVTNNYAVYPLRKADLAKDYELQQNQKFYRAKLSGKLLFSRADYTIIANANFETKFTLVISISWNNGQSWAEYWRGEFWKTDCKFDADAQTAEVTPAPVDDYTDVLAGMEKEYNLIDLKPKIEHLTITKRPLIQMYVPGESVISCFLSGMYWEQDCDPVTNENDLVNTYHFALNTKHRVIDISGAMNPQLPTSFDGAEPAQASTAFTFNRGGFTFSYKYLTSSGGAAALWSISRNNVTLWLKQETNKVPRTAPYEITLAPVSGTEATGDVTIFVHDLHVYGRYLLDVEKISGLDTYPLPANDIVENNRNYRRAIGYAINDVVYFSSETSATPTEWGLKQPGQYYVPPYLYWNPALFPIGRSHWGDLSIWFTFSATDWISEQAGRKEYTLKDAYPLHSVISVLLGKIAPGITHEPTTEYSQFLYDTYNPISGDVFDLYITQKSNILAGDYSQPAQKAQITLKMVTDMLRDCYRAYWYVEDGKFKIEHIQWFKNGGRYNGLPAISHDLTVEKVTRNGKAWAFGTSQYEYNKPTMPERYQFGWMDDVTRVFDGLPIEILSKYVTPGNIEEINVSNFTSDIDYMLLNPGACSKDGFALMAAISRNLTTPDTQFVSVPIASNFPLRYAMNGAQPGDTVTIKFAVQGSPVGYCNMAFLKQDGTPILTIGEFSEAGNFELSGIVPQDATQIGVQQITRTGITDIKVSGIFGNKYLPFVEREIDGTEYRLQNGLLAFVDLQPKYYIYDLPAYQIRINDEQGVAYGITREKKQTLRMPVVDDPNPTQLIKTFLGTGQVEKISVNLSSRNANVTLMYDTQNYNE